MKLLSLSFLSFLLLLTVEHNLSAQTNAKQPFKSDKIGNQEWMTINWDYKKPKSYFRLHFPLPLYIFVQTEIQIL